MEREIKFRAWDKDKKNMVYHENVNYDAYYNLEGWDVSDLFAINTLLAKEHYIYEQYTGLKDKNDVEIYEGDIISITNFGGFKEVWSVEFFDGGFCVYNQINSLRELRNSIYFNGTTFDITEKLNCIPTEVIGNIHDNPELL